MSKKKTKMITIVKKNKNETMTINSNDILVKSAGMQKPSFRTGHYMTSKDRPRQKDWRRFEY